MRNHDSDGALLFAVQRRLRGLGARTGIFVVVIVAQRELKNPQNRAAGGGACAPCADPHCPALETIDDMDFASASSGPDRGARSASSRLLREDCSSARICTTSSSARTMMISALN
jgi:hypothetical protein